MNNLYALAQQYSASIAEVNYICKILFGKDMVRCSAGMDTALSAEDICRLKRILELCREQIPLAYILKQEDFFGSTFFVDASVLVPRPETELLVEAALAVSADFRRRACRVLDLCSGSGNVGISILKHLPRDKRRMHLVFSDISFRTFSVLKKNAAYHGMTCSPMVCADALSAFGNEVFDLIVANPPYVEDSYLENNQALKLEPRIALQGGPDGLSVSKRILEQTICCLKGGGYLLMEIGAQSAERLRAYTESLKSYRECTVSRDYSEKYRLLKIRK